MIVQFTWFITMYADCWAKIIVYSHHWNKKLTKQKNQINVFILLLILEYMLFSLLLFCRVSLEQWQEVFFILINRFVILVISNAFSNNNIVINNVNDLSAPPAPDQVASTTSDLTQPQSQPQPQPQPQSQPQSQPEDNSEQISSVNHIRYTQQLFDRFDQLLDEPETLLQHVFSLDFS